MNDAPSDFISKYESMLEANPNNSLARFSLGKAHYDRGDFGAAKKHLDLALQQKPDWMVVQILIGKCLLELGDKASAKAAFLRGLELAKQQDHDGPREEMEVMLAELDSRV